MDSQLKESRIKVALREVGHELLISSMDSVSRVLPIERIGDEYTIKFESTFQFDPGELAFNMIFFLRKAQIVDPYLLEVIHCESGAVVHSFEFKKDNSELMPCSGRIQEKACYAIRVLFLRDIRPFAQPMSDTTISTLSNINPPVSSFKDLTKPFRILIITAIPVLFFFILFMLRKKKQGSRKTSELLPLGAYRFDKRNMTLYFKKEKTELTSKEADLLFLLYQSENQVLERDTILNIIWGDQGDYVGRTLDVFMSKLRKKLAYDSNLKIVNIRGVGYKFIMN